MRNITDTLNDIRRLRLEYFSYHGDGKPMVTCLNSGLFSYHPLIDTVVFRKFPKNIRVDEILEIWKRWFEEKDKEKRVKELEIIIQQPHLYYIPFSIFQHECRSHRLPMSISSIGTLLVYYNFRANQLFLIGLEMSKEKELFKKTLLMLSSLEYEITRIMSSSRCVLEGLASFMDFHSLHFLFKKMKVENAEKLARKFILDQFENMERKKDREVYFYRIGFDYAMKIYRKLGPIGVETVFGFALNPLLDELILVKKDLPFPRLHWIYEKIKTRNIKINKDDEEEIVKFIEDEFNWNWTVSRQRIYEKVKKNCPELFGKSLPSKDFLNPPGSPIYYLPEAIIFIDKTKKLLSSRLEGKELDYFIQNYFYTIFRREARDLLLKKKISKGNCPLRLLFKNCKECMEITDGVGHKVLEFLKERYGIKIPELD